MALGYSGAMPGAAAAPARRWRAATRLPWLVFCHARHCATCGAWRGTMTEADVKRIVAAAVKGNGPTPGGGGDAESKRKLKAEERKKRGRLPEGKRCKSGTCDLNHDEKYPGRPCYSDPRVAISVPHEYANSRPGASSGSRSVVPSRASALGWRPSRSRCCLLVRHRLRALWPRRSEL